MEEIFDEIVIGIKETIYRHGYGRIAQLVMRDSTIHPFSKVIYAYLCSFAGEKRTAFPGINLMSHELMLNKNTISKYLNRLKETGYIVVKPKKEQGKFKGNIYYIIIESDVIKAIRDGKKIDKSICSTSPISRYTVKPDMNGPDTARPDMVKADLKKIISKTNISKNNKRKTSVSVRINQFQDKPGNKKAYAEFVDLSEEEYLDLVNTYGKNSTARVIEKLNGFKGSKKGDPRFQYSSDYWAIKSWVIDALKIKPLTKVEKEIIKDLQKDEEIQKIETSIEQFKSTLPIDEYQIIERQAVDELEKEAGFNIIKNPSTKSKLIKAKVNEIIAGILKDKDGIR